jgi:3-methyl-2-oxobutanoate hydroxymethyltransferase
MGARLTVHDLLAARGTRRFAMLRVETLDEAEAAHRAGVELLSVPPAMIFDRRFREVAPEVFAFPGEDNYEIGGTGDFLKWAFPLIRHGADAVDGSGALATVRALADRGVPVCGHGPFRRRGPHRPLPRPAACGGQRSRGGVHLPERARQTGLKTCAGQSASA